jgi:hypothetical protein
MLAGSCYYSKLVNWAVATDEWPAARKMVHELALFTC